MFAVVLFSACSKVPAGNVGVKVYLLGGAKGVDTEVLTPGRYWIGVNEDLYLFPTFTQNYTWAKAADGDESISFQTVEGLSVNADIGISYSIDPAKVPAVYQKYRKGISEITDIYLRNMVRDALVTSASDLAIESVYGRGKADLIKEVEAEVRAQVQPIGINVERLYWVGDIRLPEQVTKSINAKIQATQISMQRENEVKTAEAQAAIEIAKARGDSQAVLLRAEAEAKSIQMRADALSQNARLVELNAVDKWNGVLPVNMYGSAPIPFIGLK
jgi:regulator of protease activity HflC (stomatin/prohibitin superfamily)